ncbi:hypothetical protein [Carboxydothermus pertinax]|uniref:Polyprenyl synthetase n=1 Tax=Carboxydothermus pertinax TaxID=870242 RepID=A0A1L8CX29_9THEO|nr:hypothetical protein [Carboxydothermus pertinax]GAV23441.1 hypothetical protein cpu_19510 [Carboxydothermus pertinax]
MEVILENDIQKMVNNILELITKKLKNNVEKYEEILPEIKGMKTLKRRLLFWLAVGQSLGIEKAKLKKIAEIFSYIYLAHEIHRQVLEEEYQEERTKTQYRVLVGDYMYGNFFRELARAGLLKYLNPLSKLILDINEAALLSLREGNNYQDARYFMGQCLALLGDLAQLPKDLVEELRILGEEVGDFLARWDNQETGDLTKLKEILQKNGTFKFSFADYLI